MPGEKATWGGEREGRRVGVEVVGECGEVEEQAVFVSRRGERRPGSTILVQAEGME